MKTAKLSDIIGIIGKIASPGLAESWDNSGLQVGDPSSEITGIMVSLDAAPAAVDSAISFGCQLLVTHHPLIFKPQKNISTATPQGRLIHKAIRNGLSIVSMHTNYDIAEGGLNDLLAARLQLTDCQPLQVTCSQELLKLVVYVPDGYLDKLRDALFPYTENIGAYQGCSFSVPGEGTFTPLEGSNPFIGEKGTGQRVAEHRLEMLFSKQLLPKAVKAMLAAHPYEEPAFDVYPLLNEGRKLGLGRVGRLSSAVSLADFAAAVAGSLGMDGLRFVGNSHKEIRKVAICSGSGASLLHSAHRSGADVLVTGDVKYHDARDAEDLGIALIDAGHFHTEIIMVSAVSERLNKMLRSEGFENIDLIPCGAEKDPFTFFAV
jgi:dinuclear metal center YbgI/SA1388 family protein